MIDQKRSHVRWLLVFILFALSAVAFGDRVNISITGSSTALSGTKLGESNV